MRTTDVETGSGGRVAMFASLAIRNYRLFFVGGLISNIGTWMARVAQDWLVLTELTDNSATALGIVTGLQFLPIALLAPWAGAMADRYPKRRLLMISQAALALTGLALAVLVLGGWVTMWQVYLLATLQGVAAAFEGPVRQSFAPEMVPVRLIPNAVGLNTTSFHSARLIGPAVAGLTIAAWGVGPALLLNALSFAAVMVALALMDPKALTPAPLNRGRGAIVAGLRYVRRRPDIMIVMFVVFMLGTFGLNFQLTNALMATAVFGVGPEAYGLLGSILATGSLAAGLLAARRVRPRMRLIVGALGGFSLVTAGLALAPTYAWYAVLLVPTGLFALTVMTAANASVQLAVEPAMRGRVMSLYMAIFLGGTPLGSPVIGWIGDAWGPRATLLIGSIATGVTVLVVGAYLLRRSGWTWRASVARPVTTPVRHKVECEGTS